MTSFVALFHATVQAIAPVSAEWRRLAPTIRLRHYLDEGLLPLVQDQGPDAPAVTDRLRHWLGLMERDGAAGIVTTCSSVTPTVAALRHDVSCPTVAIDESMIAEALERGVRIGVVATLESAAATTRGLIESSARAAARDVVVRTAVAPGAFERLQAGEPAGHDAAVAESALRLATEVDVLVLAQVSMIRAIPSLSPLSVPVLVSAPGAIARILAALSSAPPAAR
jgi:Asp/Glu/hydantoin racemase